MDGLDGGAQEEEEEEEEEGGERASEREELEGEEGTAGAGARARRYGRRRRQRTQHYSPLYEAQRAQWQGEGRRGRRRRPALADSASSSDVKTDEARSGGRVPRPRYFASQRMLCLAFRCQVSSDLVRCSCASGTA